MVIDPDEKKITAYHESGHALAALLLKHCDSPDKVSVIPRDMALGITSLLPGKERHNMSREYLCDQMVMLLSGRAAEKIACNTETAGAKNDIERTTEMAIAMVCEYGMSEELGPIAVNLGKNLTGNSLSVLQARAQDEVMKLIKDSYNKARLLIEENNQLLHRVAALLIEKETISGEDIKALIEKTPE